MQIPIIRRDGYGASGSSGNLNFSVVGGTIQPTNPEENTIWVNTSINITSWVFSATQPTAASGMVWIYIGTSSGVKFNALKTNDIQIYPIVVKQYVNNAWVDKVAKSYQGGKWVDWINWSTTFMTKGIITTEYGAFDNPNHYTYAATTHNNCSSVCTSDTNKCTLTWKYYSAGSNTSILCSGYTYFAKKIDVTNINSIKVKLGNLGTAYSGSWYKLFLSNKIGNNIQSNSIVASVAITADSANKEVSLDTSTLMNNSFYLGIACYGSKNEEMFVEIIDWEAVLS